MEPNSYVIIKMGSDSGTTSCGANGGKYARLICWSACSLARRHPSNHTRACRRVPPCDSVLLPFLPGGTSLALPAVTWAPFDLPTSTARQRLVTRYGPFHPQAEVGVGSEERRRYGDMGGGGWGGRVSDGNQKRSDKK